MFNVWWSETNLCCWFGPWPAGLEPFTVLPKLLSICSASVNSSVTRKIWELSPAISSISDQSTRVREEREWDCKNIWQKIFSSLCSALSLRHCSEDRWYHLAEIGLSDEEELRQKYLHNLTCWQGGGREEAQLRWKVFNQSSMLSVMILRRRGGGWLCLLSWDLARLTINVSYLFVRTSW